MKLLLAILTIVIVGLLGVNANAYALDAWDSKAFKIDYRVGISLDQDAMSFSALYGRDAWNGFSVGYRYGFKKWGSNLVYNREAQILLGYRHPTYNKWQAYIGSGVRFTKSEYYSYGRSEYGGYYNNRKMTSTDRSWSPRDSGVVGVSYNLSDRWMLGYEHSRNQGGLLTLGLIW